MADNINFIPANELPEATSEEVSVLCVEDNELKLKKHTPVAELPEATSEEVSVLCVEGGVLKQKPASNLGGSKTKFYGLRPGSYQNMSYEEVKEMFIAWMRGEARIFYAAANTLGMGGLASFYEIDGFSLIAEDSGGNTVSISLSYGNSDISFEHVYNTEELMGSI
jgi:hypothetical protein